MIDGGAVLQSIRPNGGWIITGDDFTSIVYVGDVVPVTQTEWDAAVANYTTFLANQSAVAAQVAADRQAGIDVLVKLGMTDAQAEAIANGTH